MFNAIARPFGMLLMFLYEMVNNYGVAIILIAIVIKVILLPFQMKSKRGMIQQARLQPRIAELQKKHGTNKVKINEETMKLYKEEGVNPASGCIWGFLPLPIMLALFQVIRQPITIMMGVAAEHLSKGTGALDILLTEQGFVTQGREYYEQIAQSQWITDNFTDFLALQIENLRAIDFSLGILDFSATPQWDFLWNSGEGAYSSWLAGFIVFLIPLIAGGMQFLATGINRKMNPPAVAEGQAKSMNTVMMFMPLMSVYIGFVTPAALGFYWTISTVFQIVQDVWLTKVYTKKIEAEEAIKSEARRKKEAELEAKRIETERKRAEGAVERNPNTSKRKKQKSDRQGQIEKAAEWQKKNSPVEENPKYEPSRVGSRRYARGRAYDPDRYAGIVGHMEETEQDDAIGLLDEDDIEEAAAGDDMIADDTDFDAYDGDEDDDGDEYDDDDDEDDDEYDEDDDEDDDDDDEDGPNPTVRFDTARFDERE